MRAIELLCPVWPAPANVIAGVTTRVGGASLPPYASLNLARHVNDSNTHVSSNRAQLKRFCRNELCASATSTSATQRWHWLNQTHSNKVIELAAPAEQPAAEVPAADAAYTGIAGQVCVVLTADCLPILLCDRNGSRVCAIHAGWRGLFSGIVDNTVRAICSHQSASASTVNATLESNQLLAWLGPAIGPQRFIVGEDVRQCARKYFSSDRVGDQTKHNDPGSTADDLHTCDAAFTQLPHSGKAGEVKYLADLYQLATLALHRSGVRHIYGGGFCTASDEQRFFSYRRDGKTGRMASFILLRSV